jgi:hypothetical protein
MIPIIAYHTIFVITDGVALPFIKTWIQNDPDVDNSEKLAQEISNDYDDSAFLIRSKTSTTELDDGITSIQRLVHSVKGFSLWEAT